MKHIYNINIIIHSGKFICYIYLFLNYFLMGMQNNDFHNGIPMCVCHCTLLIFAAPPTSLYSFSRRGTNLERMGISVLTHEIICIL